MNGAPIAVFDPFSRETAAISHLFTIVLLICGGILAIVVVMVGAGLFCFRHRPGAADPPPYFGNRRLEIAWTVGPILIVIWLFALTASGMRESDPALPPDREPDIVVIGHQWWWEVRYVKSGVVTANEIHLPAGSRWLVRLESADVIHDFWVPALARKIQLIPGQTNDIWLEAQVPGRYRVSCVEFCGVEHAWMLGAVIVEPPAAFAAWLGKEAESATNAEMGPARNGWKIFTAMTCINCHSLRGVSIRSGAAPDLTNLGGRTILGAGVLTNSERNLALWLKNPQAIKPGCLMPDLKLTAAQADDLANYLENPK